MQLQLTYMHAWYAIVINAFFSLTQLDQSIISAIATGHSEASNKSLIKKWCQTFTNAVCPQYFSCTQNMLSFQGKNPDCQIFSVLLRP